MTRADIEPILHDIPAARQEAPRHYGAHPYFTRRPSNVVRAYIERYSVAGDTVLDPFGGSGVTAIEALLLGRCAVHNDLNPFANFITAAIADTSISSTGPLRAAFEDVALKCKTEVENLDVADETAINRVLENVPLPTNIRLPRSSDAEFFFELFTPRQLAGLALIKTAIDEESDQSIRNMLLLAWSASVAKLNKTFLSAKGRAESRGGSSIFSIYRYKVASDVVELPIWQTFVGRFSNILAAKEDVLNHRSYYAQRAPSAPRIDSARQLRIVSHDAPDLLEELGVDTIDYIFTDPPYGGHIAYLDLSILWNHWLGFSVKHPEEEAIVGGDLRLSESHYKSKLRQSIETCMDLLRPDRWLTVVFQHWDVSYFETILDCIAAKGGMLKAAITHDKDVIWSMHKKKNAESVLSGEMLLTFYKPQKKAAEPKSRVQPISFDELLDKHLRALPTSGFRTETLFNRLTIGAWEHRSLKNLTVGPEVMASGLRERGWNYDSAQHTWLKSSSVPTAELALTSAQTPDSAN